MSHVEKNFPHLRHTNRHGRVRGNFGKLLNYEFITSAHLGH